MIEVAAAIIANSKKEILFARRSLQSSSQAGKWEFPGGKLYEGETAAQALQREIWEELHLEILVAKKFMENIYSEPGKPSLRLHSYLAQTRNENFKLNVHEEALWLQKEKAQSFEFAPADIPIYEKLLITNWP